MNLRPIGFELVPFAPFAVIVTVGVPGGFSAKIEVEAAFEEE